MRDTTWVMFEYPNGDTIGLSLDTGDVCDRVRRLDRVLRSCTSRADHHAGTWYCEARP